MKTYLTSACVAFALAAMLASCKENSDAQDPENDFDMKLNLSVDWRSLEQKPSSMTLYCYPTGNAVVDTTRRIFHFDQVEDVEVMLPEQDYAILCFNQTEKDFSDFVFDLSDYENASVTARSVDTWPSQTLAVATLNSLTGTRGVNLSGMLTPTNVVTSMSLSIDVPNITNRATVTGTLSNMASGIRLHDHKAIGQPIEQPLPPEMWAASVADGTLTATFGTFGVFLPNDTRAAMDDEQLRNELHVIITHEDETVEEITVDVTEEVVEQYIAALEAIEEMTSARDFVDLGLPSNTLWATCNVGANRPSAYGDYFAWGETMPKESYEWKNYTLCDGSAETITKYTNGRSDSLSELSLLDDAAFANWGRSWQMPTREQFSELLENTRQEWSSMSGVTGWRFISKRNGKSIFLPAAGYGYDGTTNNEVGKQGNYMSRSLCANPVGAKGLSFSSTEIFAYEDDINRYRGRSVRAVRVDSANTYMQSSFFFPESFASKEVLAWYSGVEEESDKMVQKIKYLAVYLFADGTFVVTKHKYEFVNGGLSDLGCEIEASGTYRMTYGNFVNGDADINADGESISIFIDNGMMTVFEGGQEMSDKFYIQTGALPIPTKDATQVEEESADAFFPKGYEDKNVAAWYAHSETDEKSGKSKYLAVFLFDDYTFITTKRKIESDGTETREIEASGRYSFSRGNYMDGDAYIMAAIDGDTVMMTVTIDNGEMTVYENGDPMEERFTKQNGAVPAATWATNADVEESPDAFFPLDYEKKTVAAWYAYQHSEIKDDMPKVKVLAVFLFNDNTFVSTKHALERGVETREIEASGRYEITRGDYTNGEADVYAAIGQDTMLMSITIANGVMTIYQNDNPMEESYTIQNGAVPSPSTETAIVEEPNSDLVEAVDLGLSIKWASANVGASSPEAYGNYFAWGETTGYNEGKTNYTWETYRWCNGTETSMTKYCYDARYGYEGYVDTLSVLTAYDDAATVNWGSDWRMPTADEWTELHDKCTWTLETRGDGYGYLVTGPNGNSIFLPFAGYCYDTQFYEVGTSCGDYWASTLGTDSPNNSQRLGFNSGQVYYGEYYRPRYYAQSVRAVYAPSKQNVTEESLAPVDLGLSIKWANMNVGASRASDYGNWFSWGETTGYNEGKSNYTWENYQWCKGSETSLTKYVISQDTLTVLQPSDDAATVNLGSGWRTPTAEDWQHLVDSCTWTWTSVDDTPGYTVTGPNGNSIFLPANGLRYSDKYVYEAENGEYLSSSLTPTEDSSQAWTMEFSSSDIRNYCAGLRYYGFSVRAVYSFVPE